MSVDALPAGTAKKLSPRRHHVVHAWVTQEIHQLLEREAKRRRVHPDQLVAEIVTVVIGDDMLAAVLDV